MFSTGLNGFDASSLQPLRYKLGRSWSGGNVSCRSTAGELCLVHLIAARKILMSQERLVASFTVFAISFKLLLGVAGLHAQAPVSVEQQLTIADRSILADVAGKHPDMEKFAHALAPEYEDIEQGEITAREDVLKSYARLTDFAFNYESPRAIVLSPTAGYVIANVRYSFSVAGSTLKRHKLTTTVFAFRQGEWVATLHTETSIENDREDIIAKPEDSLPDVIAMRKLAAEVMAQVRVPGYGPFPFFPVLLDAGTAVSVSNRDGAHETDFNALPPAMQQVWTGWASYTKDETSGGALFKDMFYRFFLVHELGHLIAGRVMDGLPDAERKQVMANEKANAPEMELVANRISVAWFREHDPQYLARMVSDFRLIQARIPSPVPAGADPKRYLTENYRTLSANPVAYGWYQLYMVTSVYEESPKTFQQTLDHLPKIRYNEE
jgi:hypothetical protein